MVTRSSSRHGLRCGSACRGIALRRPEERAPCSTSSSEFVAVPPFWSAGSPRPLLLSRPSASGGVGGALRRRAVQTTAQYPILGTPVHEPRAVGPDSGDHRRAVPVLAYPVGTSHLPRGSRAPCSGRCSSPFAVRFLLGHGLELSSARGRDQSCCRVGLTDEPLGLLTSTGGDRALSHLDPFARCRLRAMQRIGATTSSGGALGGRGALWRVTVP